VTLSKTNANQPADAKSSSKVLETIFGEQRETSFNSATSSSLTKVSPPKVRKFSQSISFDDNHNNSDGFSQQQPPTGGHTSSNRRLEEFKRMVESSYKQHVETNNLIRQVSAASSGSGENKKKSANEATVINNSSRLSTQGGGNSARKSSLSSVDNNLINMLRESHQQQQASLADSLRLNDSLDASLNATNVSTAVTVATPPCKVPYMSAYNVYESNRDAMMPVVLNKTYSMDEFNHQMELSARQHAAMLSSGVGGGGGGGGMPHSATSGDLINNKSFSLQQSQQQQQQHHSSHNSKYLSSNGSSLNASPTSTTSSNGSVKKMSPADLEDDVVLIKNLSIEQLKIAAERSGEEAATQPSNNTFEIKPPETPRSKAINLNFRKNLLKPSQQNPLVDFTAASGSHVNSKNNEMVKTVNFEFDGFGGEVKQSAEKFKQQPSGLVSTSKHTIGELQVPKQAGASETQKKTFADLNNFFDSNVKATVTAGPVINKANTEAK
jgi:hypothetical protein